LEGVFSFLPEDLFPHKCVARDLKYTKYVCVPGHFFCEKISLRQTALDLFPHKCVARDLKYTKYVYVPGHFFCEKISLRQTALRSGGSLSA